MQKNWQRNPDQSFTFLVDNKEAGRMNLIRNDPAQAATFTIGEDQFTLTKRGFWKRTLHLINSQGIELATVQPEKWYANHWILAYGGNTYRLSVRNNPLAEYVLADGETEILAYGLHTQNGSIQVRITTSATAADPLFDFLLWYLFAPIAMENMGDDLSFLLLIA